MGNQFLEGAADGFGEARAEAAAPAVVYRKPNTPNPALGHKVYPYRLRRLPVTRPNQAWAMAITYISIARGFVYLAAVLDWLSRRVLAWRLSISMDVRFCIEAVE
jgi:putative transposase